MKQQISLSMTGYFDKGKQTKREQFLAEMERVVPWARLMVYSAFIRFEGGNRQVAVHGMIRAWSRSSRSLSNSSQTPPGSQFFYVDRLGRSKPRIYSFADNWHCLKSAAFSHGG